MNKIQDGFYAGGDSYKPLAISSDMRHCASLSFVDGKVLIRPDKNSALRVVEIGQEIVFEILPLAVAAEVFDAEAKQPETA